MFLPGGLGSPEYEVSDLEDPSSDFPLVVPTESLLVASEVADSPLSSLLEQVDCVLLSLRGSVVVEGLHSWGVVVDVGGKHCFSSIG